MTTQQREAEIRAYQGRGVGLAGSGMVAELAAYLEEHRPVGVFLRNLISNDLSGTFTYADDADLPRIHSYFLYLYNEAPSNCWGSPDAYRNWLTVFNPEYGHAEPEGAPLHEKGETL